MEKGILYGVSVGPGDPELMTLKAVRIIKEADVIALPHSEKEKCTAYNIAVQAVPEIDEKEILLVPMPMTKDRAELKKAHENGAAKIKAELDKGKNVAFLTLGDVTVYSSCQYVYQPVKEEGYKTELVSGVTSFCAAAAKLDKPLVSGRERLHIIPATYNTDELEHLDGIKVFMKPGKNIEELKKLDICGVENCGMENEKIYLSSEDIGETGYYTLFIVK